MDGPDNTSGQHRTASFSDIVVRRLELIKGFGRVVVGSISISLLGTAHAEWIRTVRPKTVPSAGIGTWHSCWWRNTVNWEQSDSCN